MVQHADARPLVGEIVVTSAGTDRERFRAWLETVYDRVQERLGGDPDQSGDRRYGRCVFAHAANYKPGGDYGE